MSTVLVTGGAGYIGSHTCVRLLEAGHDVVVFDNLSNSSPVALERVGELAGRPVVFVEGDMRNTDDLDSIFDAHDFDAVIHFAGLKAVGESIDKPLEYYDNNVSGTLNLIAAMDAADVTDIVFSSSATVYGDPDMIPVTESASVGATNPYGTTKFMIEQILADLCAADRRWRVANLRYFNPAGAHESGRIGEDPVGTPNNLMPFTMQVAIGRRPRLNIFGDDYDTPDGTAIRDYIHVVDLADAHLAALDALDRIDGFIAVNIGTGNGYSVREVIDAVGHAVGKPIPVEIAPRRPGDVPVVYAEPTLAAELFGWKATRTLDDMCRDHWRWQRTNPDGYR